MTLVEFLLARIAEDEASVYAWDSDAEARVASMWTGLEPGYTTVASDQCDDVWIADGREVVDARHVHVQFDPARVLAECEAKRWIVAFAVQFRGQADGEADPIRKAIGEAMAESAEDALVSIASVYADHPDYDEAWRP